MKTDLRRGIIVTAVPMELEQKIKEVVKNFKRTKK